jgi:hypothetical protein
MGMRALRRSLMHAVAGCLLSACHGGIPLPAPSTCSVALGPPERLVLRDGRSVYVEPTAYAASKGEILVAGRPTFLWRADARLTADSVMGIVVGRDSVIRLVDAPIDARAVELVSAVGRDAGGWDLVMAESVSPTSRDSIARLWHGVYDGHAWTSLEQLPVPSGMRPLATGASDLIRAADTLFWALRVRDTRDFTTNVLILRSAGGGWSSERVPIRRGVYVALNHSPAAGLQLAVVAGDVTERRDENSLFIWTAAPTWAMRRRVSLGAVDGPAHHPSYVGTGPSVLTWYAETEGRREVRALSDPLHAPLESTRTIDPDFADVGAAASVRLRDGLHVWVSHHAVNEADGQLHFVLASNRTSESRTFPNPYYTSIRAFKGNGSEIVLIGAIEDQAPRRVTTALIRARITCS